MRPLLAALLGSTLLACSGEPTPLPGAVELRATHVATYGDGEGEGALSAIFDVDVDAEGRVYASEPTIGRVVTFHPNGTFLSVIGARGEGPGEFRSPGNLTWLGDTLTVLDFLRGISLFTRDGVYLDRIFFAVQGQGRRFPFGPIAPLKDGTVGSFEPIIAEDVLAGAIEYEVWLKMSRAGEVLDTLARRRLVGGYYELDLDGRPRSGNHPLSAAEMLVMPPDGASLVMATRPHATDQEVPAYRLVRIGLGGDTLQSVEIPYEPVPVTQADRTRIARAMTSLPEGDQSFEARAQAIESGIVWPEFFPAFSQVVAGQDGTVWVKRHLERNETVRWDIFDSQLIQLGYVYLPEGMDVRLVSRGWAYGIVLGEYDVPAIHRYDVV